MFERARPDLLRPDHLSLQANAERYQRSPQEMGALFTDLPEAIDNSAELSQRLQFQLKDLGYEFPRYPVGEGETMISFLRERTREGFDRRYGAQGIQWDKDDCADIGIIKVDLLALGMMAVLEDCRELIPRHYGEETDFAQLSPRTAGHRSLRCHVALSRCVELRSISSP